MNKKLLKKLVPASYHNDNLDLEKINKIAQLLTRKELKEYIKEI